MSTNSKLSIFLASTLVAIAACDTQEDPHRIVGQIESERIEIKAEFAEPIIERAVTEGQAVRAGQLLISLDTARIESRIDEARASSQQLRARLDELVRGPREELIVGAQADVRGATDELAFREADLERAEAIYARNLASTELRDRAKAARDNANAALLGRRARLDELLTGTTAEELRQAEEALRQAEARVASLEIDLERHSSKAPVDGVLDTLLFETGERPSVGQPMAIMLSGQQPYARVYVPEEIRVRVTPGLRARVYVDGLDDALTGRVRWVASEAAFTPYFALTERDRRRLTFAAKVDVLDAPSRLPDGIPVEVELLFDDDRNPK